MTKLPRVSFAAPGSRRRFRGIGSAVLGFLLATAMTNSLAAAERDLVISAPATAPAGTDVVVSIEVATHVGGSEQIGFFHAEYSADGGRNWTGINYDQNQGPTLKRVISLRTGAPGSRLVVRVRVAFRDGAAGDVDYSGAAIRWTDTWADWREPPAKSAVIAVTAHH